MLVPDAPGGVSAVPDGPDWVHEVKYDGYRLRLERDGKRVRLITRGGYNWTDRYPWIVEAAGKVRRERFCARRRARHSRVDAVSDFNALRSGKQNEEVQLCAFDILFEGDDDLRGLPLHLRKTSLERLLARRPEGIFVNPFERGEIGPDLFRAAYNMGLEGLVSKRRDRPYQPGRSKHCICVKNPFTDRPDGDCGRVAAAEKAWGSGRYAAWACWLTPLSASRVSVSSVFFSSARVASSSFTA